MSRIKGKIVEPDAFPQGELQAVSIFEESGWSTEDARWLGPIAIKTLQANGEDLSLGGNDLSEENLKVVARSIRDAARREHALVLAFVRLCHCGGNRGIIGVPLEDASIDGSPGLRPGLKDWQSLAAQFRQRGADFAAYLISCGWPGEYGTQNELLGQLKLFVREGERVQPAPELVRLMRVLWDGAQLDLGTLLSRSRLVIEGLQYSGPDEERSPRLPPEINLHADFEVSPRSLLVWMLGCGPRVLSPAVQLVIQAPNLGMASALAGGIRAAIERWLACRGPHWSDFSQGGDHLARACVPLINHLESLMAAEACDGESGLRRLWLWFSRCVYLADRSVWVGLGNDHAEAAMRSANQSLAALRKLLARAKPKPLRGRDRELAEAASRRRGEQLPALTIEDLKQGHGFLLPVEFDAPEDEKVRVPWEEFEWERDHASTCVTFLYEVGGVWRGLKPMLLAWRSLGAPGVARDLRYWAEDDREPVPQPWSEIIAWPINLFHAFVGREQREDQHLEGLRGNLAMFCLERLVDRWTKEQRAAAEASGARRTDDDMLERSPFWRYCYVRAAGSLGVNPEGKGHRILKVAAELDPDEDVRDAARQCYEQLRRNVGLPVGVSPRRAIMSALWWLRQAHLLALGVQVDETGAQRTRVKELARTKELEGPVHPRSE